MNPTKNEASPQYLSYTKAPQENKMPANIPSEYQYKNSEQNSSK